MEKGVVVYDNSWATKREKKREKKPSTLLFAPLCSISRSEKRKKKCMDIKPFIGTFMPKQRQKQREQL